MYKCGCRGTATRTVRAVAALLINPSYGVRVPNVTADGVLTPLIYKSISYIAVFLSYNKLAKHARALQRGIEFII